jgi:hypothetical protein
MFNNTFLQKDLKNQMIFLLTLFHEKLPFGKIYSSYLKLLRNFGTNNKHYTTNQHTSDFIEYIQHSLLHYKSVKLWCCQMLMLWPFTCLKDLRNANAFSNISLLMFRPFTSLKDLRNAHAFSNISSTVVTWLPNSADTY